ncbi:hypothetical protein Y032_0010g905 [Ancylostoma ceylanicum]|uniref:Uncharacterized protein n=1 Tax=Ancylostoma ceylanicum TaxID=53326 RepID=A0A016VGY6_9BILA|nr:hypothetical protein Y032_0010g905 [Ancylostoma ceylanicum]
MHWCIGRFVQVPDFKMTSALSTRQQLLMKAANRLGSLLNDVLYQPQEEGREMPVEGLKKGRFTSEMNNCDCGKQEKSSKRERRTSKARYKHIMKQRT